MNDLIKLIHSIRVDCLQYLFQWNGIIDELTWIEWIRIDLFPE